LQCYARFDIIFSSSDHLALVSRAVGTSTVVMRFVDASEDRYSRQRLIDGWDQDRLATARVVVVGAGALGNEVLKILALVGIGSIVVVDFDIISVSNLSRTVLFREGDVGKPKATVAAERTRELNPDVHVTAISGDVSRDLGLGVLARADLVLGGLDSINARWALNRRCCRVGVPWINAGISAQEGQVTRYVPGVGPCYKCTMTPSMLRRFNERRSCTTNLPLNKADQAMPTTAIGASAIAALQTHDALTFLHDSSRGLLPGHRLTLLLQAQRLIVDELLRNPLCDVESEDWLWTHIAPVEPAIRFDAPPDVFTPASLIATVASAMPDASTISLGFELVESFDCPQCGATEVLCRPADTLKHDDALCSECGVERTILRSESIGPSSRAWERPLDRLGVAPNEILGINSCTGEQKIWVELGGEDAWQRR
jgi:molybdopterin/thiamine biosynthesis adenylyltransferase/predicted RNA-binding Zn-ribbon protein involved in translation (DUF1610 family)